MSHQKCTSGVCPNCADLIEELRRKIRTLRREARFDALTSLPNRRSADDELQRVRARPIRTGKRFSIVMVDIDHFKKINDHYGHGVGDQVLQQFAKLLKKNIRTEDFVARLSGEEFLIILPDTSQRGAKPLIERLRKEIRSSFIMSGNLKIQITASFGIAEQQEDESLENLRERADKALYKAKNAGRDRVMAA